MEEWIPGSRQVGDQRSRRRSLNSLRLRSLLNRAGVEVVMTRVDDYDLAGAVGSAPAVRKRHDLQERFVDQRGES